MSLFNEKSRLNEKPSTYELFPPLKWRKSQFNEESRFNNRIAADEKHRYIQTLVYKVDHINFSWKAILLQLHYMSIT